MTMSPLLLFQSYPLHSSLLGSGYYYHTITIIIRLKEREAEDFVKDMTTATSMMNLSRRRLDNSERSIKTKRIKPLAVNINHM